VEQSSQGNFVDQGQNDILIVVIDTKKHLDRVCISNFSISVRQYFRSVSPYNSSVNQEMMEELAAQLTHRLSIN